MSSMNTNKASITLRSLFAPPEVNSPDLQRRAQGLAASKAAGVFMPDLERLYQEIIKPRAQRSLGVFNEVLRLENISHDAFGRALWYGATAVLEDPEASDVARTAAGQVLAVFLPSRSELRLDTVSEIENALRREGLIEAHEVSLLQVPAADGRTAKDYVLGMVKAAKARAAALEGRGTQPDGPDGDGTLWAQVWGLLNEFRRALAREVANTPALPRDLEKLVFGLMDELVA
jgi:hypothetical protein